MLEDVRIEKEAQDSFTYHFFFNHGLFDELYNFRQLIDETENYLSEKVKVYTDTHDLTTTDERFGLDGNFKSFFPYILWKSLLLSLYFQMESALNQICENLKKSNNYELELKDISGNGIFKSSLYLKKVCGIKIPFQSDNWNKLIEFNKVRNMLVHTDGILKKSNTNLIKVCEKYEGIILTDFTESEYSVSITMNYCKSTLDNVVELFNQIYSNMSAERPVGNNV
jgi:hypothetical protein